MRERLVFFLLLFMVSMSYGQKSWKEDRIKLPPVVCYASNESHQSFIGPPAEFFEKLKSGSTEKASIIVTYVGFPVNAKVAFQYAVDIWENLIESPVPIHITATWESLSGTTLGSCGPSDYYKNFNSTELLNCYYPVALAEKMLGEEINGAGVSDIEASFNKDFTNWYFGTDGKTPTSQYDFVSVVLHELTHGLGFVGNFYTNRSQGGYGKDGFPAVFDKAVENKTGQKLVSSAFVNPSIKLYQQLTSDWLVFDTQITQGSLPRIYAPTTWDTGSSIYHLNESTYPARDVNSLMTPFSGKGEAIHNPGETALSMMYYMGWKMISIRHTPLKDIELVPKTVSFDATITSDYDLDTNKLFLIYSSNKFLTKDSVLLKSTAIPSGFSASLNLRKNGELDYFFSATDIKGRRFVYPSGGMSRYLSITIGPDKESPVVVHDPIKYLLTTDLNTKISAQVTDNIAVQSVKLEYFVNGGLVKSTEMKKDSDDVYSGELTFQAGSIKDIDVVSYRIVAIDASSNSNLGRLPLSGYFKFRIAGFRSPVESYENNFSVDTLDFISSHFRIYTVSGFDNSALNSPHPYPSPDVDNGEFNFTTTLKHPIILKSGSKMSFDEIVLIEPGETGVKFGNEGFYDYVIAEGSSDKGITWKPLADGYDSNLVKSWANLYNGSITDTDPNSTSVPTKDLFVKHEIDLLANGNFMVGDTIQIRFRLFSDPYAHGWGWMIDNLKIQDIGTSVNPVLLSSGEVSYYPNPATDRLNLHVQGQKNIHKLFLKVYNLSGRMVYSQQLQLENSGLQTDIDVSNFVPGLYLFSLEPENGQVVARKILIQDSSIK